LTATPRDPLLEAVLVGLRRPQKALPPTLFYDARGSALFERITTLDEYYLTRAEAEIFRTHGAAIGRATATGADAVALIEPGCGSASKVGALLRHVPAVAWVGIDVAAGALEAGARALAAAFPAVEVHAVTADYHRPVTLPSLPSGRRVAFFPGSTIGNFDPDDAVAFLARLRGLSAEDGRVVVGVDLWKSPEVLHAAYDDREGVTALFDKNALAHLNARYGATFDVDRFDHVARVDPGRMRVEMHLRSRGAQAFEVAGERFVIEPGETIHTENSYKYTVDGFAALAARAALEPVGAWTDAAARFAVFVFAPRAAP